MPSKNILLHTMQNGGGGGGVWWRRHLFLCIGLLHLTSACIRIYLIPA